MRTLILATRPTEPNRGDPSPGSLLVRALIDRGHEVHLVCSGGEPLRSFDTLTVQPVHGSRSIGVPAYTSVALDAAKSFGPDCVLAEREHLALGRVVASRAKASLVAVVGDSQPGTTSPIRRLMTPLDARLIRSAVACIGYGPLHTDAALQLGAARVIELPGVCGIEPISRDRTGWLREHLKLDSGILALAWSDLSPEHGTDILIEGVKVAADADADVHAAIFGGDETSIDRYEAKAERLGIQDRVHLLGEWPAPKLGMLLPEADVLVEPSLAADRIPPAFYSFLASHRPVVLAESPGRQRLINEGACVFAPPDRLGIGHMLATLASNADARDRIARAAATFVSDGHMYDTFRDALASLEQLVDHNPENTADPDQSQQAHVLGR